MTISPNHDEPARDEPVRDEPVSDEHVRDEPLHHEHEITGGYVLTVTRDHPPTLPYDMIDQKQCL